MYLKINVFIVEKNAAINIPLVVNWKLSVS